MNDLEKELAEGRTSFERFVAKVEKWLEETEPKEETHG